MDHTRCKYLSKPCANVRSLKDDGALHRFCTFHRNKANDTQRRWHARRRQNRPWRHRTHSSSTSNSSTSTSADDSDSTSVKRRRRTQDDDDDHNATSVSLSSPVEAEETWSVVPQTELLDEGGLDARLVDEWMRVRGFATELDDVVAMPMSTEYIFL